MNIKVKTGIIFGVIFIFGIVALSIASSIHIMRDVSAGQKVSDSANSRSSQSFHPNAWEFADLVTSDVLYPVDHVIDGDTLVINVLGHDITVRLIGMDTPETVDPRKPVECFGPEASAEAKRIFAAGDEISVEKDPAAGDYDIYGRLLAYVFPPQSAVENDGSPFPASLSYNEYMIQKGFAREYTYKNEPYKYQSQFKADQKAAKAGGIGVWNKSVCPKPFSY